MIACYGEKNDEREKKKIFKVFFGSGFVLYTRWAPCCETWLKLKLRKEKKIEKKKCLGRGLPR
jgi:hypothetical protein